MSNGEGLQNAIDLESQLIKVYEKEKQISELRQERSKMLRDDLSVMKEQVRQREQELNKARDQIQKLKDAEMDFSTAGLEQFKKQNEEAYAAIAQYAAENNKTVTEMFDDIATRGDEAFAEVTNAIEAMRGRLQDANQTMEELGQYGGKFANSLGLAAKSGDTTAGKIMLMGRKMLDAQKAGVGFGDMMGAVLGRSFNLQNILFSVLDILGKFAIETDNVAKGFQKATGFTGNFRDNIQSVSANLVAAGVTAEDVGKNLQTLASNYSMFQKGADEVNNELLTNISLLEKVGVSASDSAQNLNFLTRSLQMTEMEANKVNLQIATMGDEMGVQASKMMSDFKAVSGTLSVYGDRMIGVFQELAATAKATGMEVSSLVTLGQKFDTFSDAASNAGKLNAVLGTNISAMEMMNMTEAERVQMLREQIKMSVGNFDNLDKYTQKFIAQSLGLKDVAEARALVNMSESEYLDNLSAQQDSLKTQEEMLKMTKDLVPVLDQMKMAFMELVLALSPLLSLMSSIIDFTSGMIQVTREHWYVLGLMALGIYALIAAKKKTFLIGAVETAYIYGLIAADKIRTFWTGVKTKGLWASIKATYAAATANITLGWAMLFAAGAVLLIGGLIFLLYKHLTRKGSPEFYKMFAVIALGVIAFGVALYFIQGPAQVTLVLILALALAVALMFYSIGDIVTGMTSLAEAIAPLGNSLMTMGGALFFVAGGLIAVGAAGLISAIGIAAAVVSLGSMLLVMAAGGMNFGDMKTAGDSVEKMGAGVLNLANGMGKIKSMAAELSAMENMGDGFLAITSDGGKTSAVMGSGDIMENFVDGKMTVDVKMPEISMPEITLIVNVDKNGGVDIIKKIARG